MANPTLLDIAIANGSDPVVGLIEETVKATPEIMLGAARTIKGLSFKTLVRTAVPAVGFRAANSGTTPVKGTYENRTYETYFMNPQWNCDKMVADVYEDGAEAWIALEASGIMTGAFQTLAKQFYYGAAQGGDSLGFPGLLAFYDSTNMVVDAGGTTDSTASSVWACRFGAQDLQWVWGNNGQLEMAPVRIQSILDANNAPYTAYIQELFGRPGLQCSRVYAAGRIKKLTADAGKGLTDALLSKLLSLFPVAFQPDCFLMNRRSRQQLQASRTATNPTGQPAPIPDSAFSIPIWCTDAILSTETLAL